MSHLQFHQHSHRMCLVSNQGTVTLNFSELPHFAHDSYIWIVLCTSVVFHLWFRHHSRPRSLVINQGKMTLLNDSLCLSNSVVLIYIVRFVHSSVPSNVPSSQPRFVIFFFKPFTPFSAMDLMYVSLFYAVVFHLCFHQHSLLRSLRYSHQLSLAISRAPSPRKYFSFKRQTRNNGKGESNRVTHSFSFHEQR